MAALARARAAQVEETEDETRRRVEWIKHYVKTGQPEKALELGWDGKPIEAPAEPTVRQQKLQRAASTRMSGLESSSRTARTSATARRFCARRRPGLLHIHEISGAELKTPNGRAKKIGVAHSRKWLRISVQQRRRVRGGAARGRLRVDFGGGAGRDRDPASESWHAARCRNRGGAEAGNRRRGRCKAAVDALTATALEHVDFGRPALCFENERLGVSAALAAACDGAMTIPMLRAHREPQRVRRRRARHPLWPRGARRRRSAPSASTPRAAT